LHLQAERSSARVAGSAGRAAAIGATVRAPAKGQTATIPPGTMLEFTEGNEILAKISGDLRNQHVGLAERVEP
jgi:hypothetical protein